MSQSLDTRQPIHELLARRWSPRALSDRRLEPSAVISLFEAARWAPSSYNEQPWVFLAATADDAAGHARLADLLVAGNAWARRAPLLIVACTRDTFTRNGEKNRHAQHDLGLAVENLLLEAYALGLVSHAMAGFDAQRARAELNLPAGYEALTMIAVGYPGDPAQLDEKLRASELQARQRKPLEQVVRGAGFGQPLAALAR